MGEILSHSEIEAILSAVDFETTEAPLSVSHPADAVADIQFYDFEHPTPLRPSQMDALRLSAATATQSLQISLETLLRTPVVANFLAVEQSTFKDYLATSENPTCLAVLQSSESAQVWLLDMSRVLAFTFVDCLLGGSPCATGVMPTRPFTGVETRMIEKAITTALRALDGDLLQTQSLQMTQLVSESSLRPEVSIGEAVALVSFEIACGPCQGLVQLCVPWQEIAASSPLSRFAASSPNERTRFAATKVPVTATARIAKLKLAARDLANLSLGDVLLTDADASAGLSLEVDGREIFRGTAGQSRDRKVVLLTTSVVSVKKDLTSS